MKSISLLFLLYLLFLFSCGEKGGAGTEVQENIKEKVAEQKATAQKTTSIGVVMAESGISLRKSPGTEGEKIGKLSQYDTVTVVNINGPKETIEEMDSRWMEVDTKAGESGWVFGGFVAIEEAAPHCHCPAKKAYYSHYEDLEEGYLRKFTRGVRYQGSAKLPCYVPTNLSHSSGGYTISEAGRWVATDDGTGVFGGLDIIDLKTGEVAKRMSYDRGLNSWEGETLQFTVSTGKTIPSPEGTEGEFWEETEEMEFRNGKVVSTGKKGKTRVE